MRLSAVLVILYFLLRRLSRSSLFLRVLTLSGEVRRHVVTPFVLAGGFSVAVVVVVGGVGASIAAAAVFDSP